MTTDRIDIIVTDKVDKSLRQNFAGIAASSKSAATNIDKLTAAIKGLEVNKLEKMAAAFSKVTNANAKLINAQQRAIEVSRRGSMANQKLATEATKTAMGLEKVATQAARTSIENTKAAGSAELLKQKLARTTIGNNNVAASATRAATALIQQGSAATTAKAKIIGLEAASIRLVKAQKHLYHSTSSLTNVMRGFIRVAAVIGSVAFLVGGLSRAADAFTNMENKVKNVTTSAKQNNKIMGKLFDLAKRARAPIQDVTKSFIRFDLAMKEIGRSQAESLRLTETFSKTLTLYGATTGETAAALLQLSQAFNKGKLDGDEFRSVMELMPSFMKKVAKVMGVTKGALLDLAPQGKITANIMAEAGKLMAKDVDKAFGNTTKTIAQAFNHLSITLTQWWGTVEKSTGIGSKFADTIIWIADNGNLLKGIIVGIGTVFLVTYTPAILGATKAMYLFTAALLTNPLVLLGVAVGALVGYMSTLKDEIKITTDYSKKLSDSDLNLASTTDLASRAQKGLTEQLKRRAIAQAKTTLSELSSQKNKTILDKGIVEKQIAFTEMKFFLNKADKDAALAESQVLFDSIETRLTDLNSAYQDTMIAISSFNTAPLINSNGLIEGSLEDIGDKLSSLSDPIKNVKSAYESLQLANENGVISSDNYLIALINMQLQFQKMGGTADQFEKIINKINEASAPEKLNELANEIKKINQEAIAMSQGAAAVEALKKSFERTDAIAEFEQKLIDAKKSTIEIKTQLDEFTESLDRLAKETQEADVDKTIAEIAEQTKRLNQEAIALKEGTTAVENLKRSFAESDAITEFENRLVDAGNTGSGLESVIYNVINALLQLNSVASQVTIDAAFDKAADATDRLKRETIALSQGKNAFEAFKDAEKVSSELNTLEKNLRKTDAAEEDIIATMDSRKKVLEDNIAANKAYQLSLIKPTKRSGGGGGKSKTPTTEIEELAKALTNLTKPYADAKSYADQLKTAQENGIISNDNYSASLDKLKQKFIASGGSAEQFAKIIGKTSSDISKALKGVADNAIEGFASAIADLVVDGKANFEDLAKSIIKQLIKIAVQFAITQAIKFLFPGFEKGGSFGVTSNANGNAFANDNIPKFAKGGDFTNGVVNKPTMFQFAKGNGFGLGEMGEAGPEAIMPLERGTDGKLGVNAHNISNNSPTINIIHDGSTHVEVVQTSPEEIRIIAKQVVYEETPKVVSKELSDPNSRSSRSLNRNTNAGRRAS